MEPEDLARELGVSGKRFRNWLRQTFPRSEVDRYARWSLTATGRGSTKSLHGREVDSVFPPPTRPVTPTAESAEWQARQQ